MRGTVVGVAVLMGAAIAGVGALALRPFLFPGKPKTVKVTRDDEGAAPRSTGSRAGKGRTGAAAGAKARPTGAPSAPDEDDDDPGPRAARPGEPDGPTAAGRPRGTAAPGQPNGLIPGVDDPLPGAAATTGAGPSIASIYSATPFIADGGSACPPGMVDVGSFCIDANETTNTQYKAFLDARPNRRNQPQTCSWNLDYTPTYGAPPADTRPVVGVNWCDAWLFCNWSGKRMCGRMGVGGNNSPGQFTNAASSEWYYVCSNNGESQFSYGDTFDGTKCAHAGDDGTLAPVGSVPTCVGKEPPFDSVFDMSGNAWEWEDSCAGASGQSDLCRVRGGGTHASSEIVSCNMDYLAKREQTFRTVGIRCCGPRRPGAF
jgi:formylglycine-generating enzyme required for sulfatase activity